MILINSVQRTLIFIVIIAMLPSLCIILYSGIEERQKAITMLREEENKDLETLISKVKIKQDSIYNTLRLLAQTEEVRQGSAGEAKGLLSFFVNERKFLSNMYLVTKNGELVASLEQSLNLKRLLDTPWMKEALASRKFYVSYPRESKRNPGQLVVTYVFPVSETSVAQGKRSDEEPERYLIAESAVLYDASEMAKQHELLASDAILTVRDEQGKVLVQSIPKNPKLFENIDNDHIWKKIQNCGHLSGTLHMNSKVNSAYVVSFRRTSRYVSHEGHELTIILTKAVSDNVLRANQVLTRELILLVLTFFFSIAIALLLGRYVLINPITMLLSTLQEWTKGNYDAKVNGKNLHGEMGELAHAYNEMADAVELRRKEILSSKLAVEVASKAKSEFIATMSHELRTPMNAILGMAFLAMKADTRSKQQMYINKIYSAAKSLFGIINGILDFSKIESEGLKLENKEFKPKEVLADMASLAHSQAEEKGLKLRLHIDNDVPESLVGDPLRLAQALNLLLSNAIKFTEHGEVNLSCEVGNHIGQRIQLRFMVKDTGIGLSPEQQKQIFSTFSQIDGSLTRKFGGVGLGLAIAKNIIEVMDGAISVKSELGEGSTFTFTAMFSHPNKVRIKKLDQSNVIRILVVDDEETTLYTLQSMLESMRFQADKVPSAEEAFAILSEKDSTEPIHIVLMDWRMPGIDGIKATNHILTKLNLKNPPSVFIVTGVVHPNPEDMAKKSGALGVIYKPVTESILFDTISDTLLAKGYTLSHSSTAEEFTYNSKKDYHLEGINVLLVEDNVINQEVAHGLLDSLGINVTIASNGDEAIEIINKSKANPPFTLILMDLQMPNKDGYETTLEIRKRWKKEELPIIAMTAHTLSDDRARCYEVGMNDHVAKPINIDKFFCTLQAWANVNVTPEEVNITGPRKSELTERDFLNLPGINSSLALSRLGKNTQLYYKVLQQFLQLYANISVSFFEALSNERISEAQRIAHTLKGLGGSIGAENLAKEFDNLETYLAEGKREKAEELALTCFNELDFVIEGLRQFFEKDEQPSTKKFIGRNENVPLSEEEKKTIAKIFEKIESLLQESDPDAITLFSSQCDALQNLLPQKVYNNILKELERYEFDDALKRIIAYRKEKEI